MKIQITGHVEYQIPAFRKILELTQSQPDASAQTTLERSGVYSDKGLRVELRDRTLHVSYTGPEERATRLDSYFNQVARFGGSHLAMTAADKQGRRNTLNW